jgi:hypothetical protein
MVTIIISSSDLIFIKIVKIEVQEILIVARYVGGLDPVFQYRRYV